MTIQTTSLDAYRQLVADGNLVGKQATCLERLIALGQATSGEVLDSLGIKNVNAWRARFTELQGRGLIREVGQRKCKISGRAGIVWAPTGRTKPLDVNKGAREPSAKAWRAIAMQLVDNIELGISVGHPDMAKSLEAYRKLRGRR